MAVKAKAAFLWVTQGGIRVDEKWRALKADGASEIPGLYVGSADAGGMMKPYNFGMENYFQQAASAIISGKIAGTNAALEALGKEPV
jgi:succinate dehydrogenase/fumarate reductase flavoprotein subunit